MKNRTTPQNITKLKANEIFVFGSNADGNHAGGAAKLAKDKFKAKQGVARGNTGKCYAIDTMSGLDVIKGQIEPFFSVCNIYPQNIYLVTEIGCGIAGYTPEQIAPLFKNAPENVWLPESFWRILNVVKGYKIFDPQFKCRDYQFSEHSEHIHKGNVRICNSGFHFCLKLSDCFSYYNFDKHNIVCEVEAIGEVEFHSDDSKGCTNHLKIGKRLTWEEVLLHANEGMDNTGHSNSGNSNSGYSNSGNSNSGYSNSGYRNSGDWNSGNSNSGDSNSGYSNSGNSNSGYSNSGNRNSGDWNSGDRNSGDSNSGYRNSGAFCLDPNPKLILFDKECSMSVKEWENSAAVNIMNDHLNQNIWIYSNSMTEQEKKDNPKHETTDGYLKTITLKEAWSNMWGNLTEENKKVFTSLENFDATIFESITGIKI